MDGKTFIEVNYNFDWLANSLAGIDSWQWLYQGGMYAFLLATIAIAFWIFFDSINKKKDQKSLIPRILSLIGFFAVIPAFIFRFTGTSDGVSNLVKFLGQPVTTDPMSQFYAGAITYNVRWLLAGYGSIIAMITLLGVVISVVALIIYASTVQRARPSTEFVGALNNKFSELERQVNSVKQVPSTPRQTIGVGGQPAGDSSAATIFDRKPAAATIIERPSSGSTIKIISGVDAGRSFNLPASDVKIGRDSSNFIVLSDGKSSREQAKLLYNGGAWLLLDLGSANGTYLNDSPATGQLPLNNGDIIRIGDTNLQFSKVG